jgi:hypothetical protein
MVARKIFDALNESHELHHPIEDLKVLDTYADLIELLTSIFAPIGDGKKLIRFTGPFNTHPFYHSASLVEFLKKAIPGIQMDKSPGRVKEFLIIRAGCIILKKYYQQEQLGLVQPYTFSSTEPRTGLEYHIQSNIDDRFVKVVKKKPLKPLSQDQINELLADVQNVALWLEYLPPENFEFHGVICTEL